MPHSYKVTIDSLIRSAQKFHEAEKEKNHQLAQFHEIRALAAADILRVSDPPQEASREIIHAFILELRKTKTLLGSERYGKHIKSIIVKLDKHFMDMPQQ